MKVIEETFICYRFENVARGMEFYNRVHDRNVPFGICAVEVYVPKRFLEEIEDLVREYRIYG